MTAKITSDKPVDRFAVTNGVLKWILLNLVVLLALGFSLFLAAGRIDWGLGWLYLGVTLAGQTATTLILLPTNPTLLGERAWMQKGSKSWDKVIVSLVDAGWIGCPFQLVSTYGSGVPRSRMGVARAGISGISLGNCLKPVFL